MATAAAGIMCKAPRPGASKTRLAAVLGSQAAASLSACFLRDVAASIEAASRLVRCRGYAVYAPADAGAKIASIVPASFGLIPQVHADFGVVLHGAAASLLALGHDCVVLINADSPTLPPALIVAAIEALRASGDAVVLGPAIDGGYYLIGLRVAHRALFRGIPWSTPDVCRLTIERAREAALPVVTLPAWYDVDDAATLSHLTDELVGRRLPFADPGLVGGPAEATRRLMADLGLLDEVAV